MSDDDRQVSVQKIYLLDASVEVPKAPEIFTKQWKPEVDVQLGTSTKQLAETTHQVQIKVTVTAKLEDTVAYLVETEYAGIFDIKGIDDKEQLKAVLGGYCPGLIFPFLREGASDLVQRAGFPQFLLQPVNFDALYQQHVAKQSESEETAH